MTFRSWWRSRYDGGSCVPSSRFVRPSPPLSLSSSPLLTSTLPHHRHDKSTHAALAASAPARGPETRVRAHGGGDREAGDAAGAVQGAGRGAHGDRAQDGDPVHVVRGVQADARGRGDADDHGAGHVHGGAGGGRDRSRGRGDADGGGQDPAAGAAPQHGGPAGHPQVPQRRARAVHGRQGGGRRRPVPRRQPHRPAPGQQPGRQLHRLHLLQGGPAQVAAAPRRQRGRGQLAQLADHPDRPRQRRHGPPQQRAHRHHQDPPAEDARGGGRLGF